METCSDEPGDGDGAGRSGVLLVRVWAGEAVPGGLRARVLIAEPGRALPATNVVDGVEPIVDLVREWLEQLVTE